MLLGKICLSGFEYRTVEENRELYKNKMNSLVEKYIPLIFIKTSNTFSWFTVDCNAFAIKRKSLQACQGPREFIRLASVLRVRKKYKQEV